jgi:hypothetical protein
LVHTPGKRMVSSGAILIINWRLIIRLTKKRDHRQLAAQWLVMGCFSLFV